MIRVGTQKLGGQRSNRAGIGRSPVAMPRSNRSGEWPRRVRPAQHLRLLTDDRPRYSPRSATTGSTRVARIAREALADQGDGQQDDADHGERQRIAGLDARTASPPSARVREARRRRRRATPATASTSACRRSCAARRSLRAERHADADLLRPLRDAVGDDAVDPDRGQQQRRARRRSSAAASSAAAARPRSDTTSSIVLTSATASSGSSWRTMPAIA